MFSKTTGQNVEFFSCFFIWIGAVLFSLFNIYEFSQDVDSKLISENISEGWYYLNKHKDVSDYEWSYWKNLTKSLIPWLLTHSCVAEFMRHYNYVYQQIWYCTVSFLFVLYNFGFIPLLFMMIQPIIYWFILICKGTTASIWICTIFCSLTINLTKNLYEMKNYHFLMITKFSNENFYIVLVAVSWIQLRCISCSLDNIQDAIKRERFSLKEFRISKTKYEFLNIFSYCFYLPFLFLGPIILYKDFMKSFYNCSSFSIRCYELLLNMIRYIFWFFFTEVCLHFIYFNAFHFNLEIIEMMPNWSLYGGGLWMGLYFYLKYLVTYGTAGTVASFDNIIPENPPRCVLRIHLYSQMWKYFDVGLHKFLIKYIYKPILSLIDYENVIERKFILLAVKSFASLICFVFVFLWHGVHYFIFLWSMLNYLGIVLETTGKFLSERNILKTAVKYMFTDKSWLERFYAFISTPVLIVSALSNFYFFGGAEVGDIFVIRFLNQSLFSFTIMFFCLYCSCRVSQFCVNVHATRIKVK